MSQNEEKFSPNHFRDRLIRANKEFRMKDAVSLSMEIHEAEAKGYRVTLYEDRLWFELTNKIVLKNME